MGRDSSCAPEMDRPSKSGSSPVPTFSKNEAHQTLISLIKQLEKTERTARVTGHMRSGKDALDPGQPRFKTLFLSKLFPENQAL